MGLERTENAAQYKKIINAREVEKSKNLKWVLEEIFAGTPVDRVSEIENILKKAEIYLGSDMEIADTNDLREKTSLIDIEILKIEEFIKKRNRERYDDMKEVQKMEDKKKINKLKMEDELNFYALKHTEELEFMQFKAQEEQKMLVFKVEGKRLLREQEKELMEAMLKIEVERENMKMQREQELMGTRLKIEMEREDNKMKREKELMEARTMDEKKRDDIKLQREMELRNAKYKEEMEKEEREMEKRENLIVAKAKEEKQIEPFKIRKEINKKFCDSLISEKKGLQDDVRNLENEGFRLKRAITENSQKGIKEIFTNSSMELRKAEDCEERKNFLDSKNYSISEMNLKMETKRFLLKKEKKLMKSLLKIGMEIDKLNNPRENDVKMQIKKMSKYVVNPKAKEELKRERFNMLEKQDEFPYDFLLNEKKDLMDDVRDLENKCIQLKRVIAENSQKGIKGFFKNSSMELKNAEDEYEERKKSLKSKRDRIMEIDQELRNVARF